MKIDCKSYPFRCRVYELCKLSCKDCDPGKCKIRFDWEFQARRNLICGKLPYEIQKMQGGGFDTEA